MDREAHIQNWVYQAKGNKIAYVDLAFRRDTIWEEERL